MSVAIVKHKIDAIAVGQRQLDGYINATALAKAYEASTGTRKDVRDWLLTERARSYLEHLSAKTGIPVLELVQVKKGGNAPGTWLHPKLATPFATWLSVEYEFQVSEWVEQWMATKNNPIQGDAFAELKAEIASLRQDLQQAIISQPQQPAKVVYLPPPKLTVDDYLKHETAEQREQRIVRERAEVSAWMQ